MLRASPNFSLEPPVSTSYKITIFMLLDAQSGPLDIQEVNSIQELYLYYNSEDDYSKSYILAKKLLSLGYRLLCRRVKSSNMRISAAVSDNEVFYPNYYEKYDYNTSSLFTTNRTNGLTYTFDIVVNSVKLNDYLVININNKYWYGIVFSGGYELPPGLVSYQDASLVFNPSNNEANIQTLVTAIKKDTGFLAEYLTNSRGQKIIRVTSTSLQMIPSSSFSIEVDEYSNYDVDYLTNYKSVYFEVYSKYDSSVSDISITINQLYDYYEIIVNKHALNPNRILFNEVYQVGIDELNLASQTRINTISNLIEIKFIKNKLPLGTYWLDRVVPLVTTNNDFYNSLVNLEVPSKGLSTDLIIDSGINDKKFNTELQKIASNKNLVLSSTYNNPARFDKISPHISFFEGTITDLDSNEFPSYLLFLTILSETKFSEGGNRIEYSVSDTLDKSRDLPTYEYNSITTDGYYNKLINPIAYYNSKLMSMDGAIKLILNINKITNDLNKLTEPTESSCAELINKSISSVSTKVSNNLNIVLDELVLNNNELVLILAVEVTTSNIKKFRLNINLNQVMN